jgi:hypothetical protein
VSKIWATFAAKGTSAGELYVSANGDGIIVNKVYRILFIFIKNCNSILKVMSSLLIYVTVLQSLLYKIEKLS